MDPSQAAEIEAALPALLDRFYARVRADAELGPVFNDAVEDWSRHLATLADFWSSVMLTSGRYKGNPMQAHLKHGRASVRDVRALAGDLDRDDRRDGLAGGRRRAAIQGRAHRPEPGPGHPLSPAQGGARPFLTVAS
jgi:hypothetical protein